MNLPNAPVPSEGFLVTHFLTVSDQVKSREFYAGILGGEVLTPENPCIIKLANSWIVLNNECGSLPQKLDRWETQNARYLPCSRISRY
jgi:hypothetical protein